MALPRLLRTIRHLRPSQIFWRGRYALGRRLPVGRKRIRIDAAPPNAEGVAVGAGFLPPADHSPLPRREIVPQLARGIFDHLNETRSLGRPVDWRLGPCETGRLWTVTLHYHRWAWELAHLAGGDRPADPAAGDLFVELVSDWIERCDLRLPGARDLAWNAFAIATRIGWWVRAYAEFGDAWWRERPEFRSRYLTSLRRQAGYLSAHVEWDLRGNHLLRDAAGLAWAARLFPGADGEKWGRLARSLAVGQAREQVLADGGHFERSPMYHLQAMDDLLTASTLLDDLPTQREIDSVLLRMHEWARWVRHPDGDVPQLNDAALGAESAFSEISARMLDRTMPIDRSAPQGGRLFADAGLAVWHGDPWCVFFDVGPIGPDYQPGHGHADTLSLECSYRGVRLFVDPGVHSYDCDARRAYDRSTAAHNTVCVNDADSSEVWDIFRVGRRAKPFDVAVCLPERGFEASAAHDGFVPVHGVVHRRSVRVADGRPMVIVDRIEGNKRASVQGGWLLEPAWTATPTDDGWIVRRDDCLLRIAVAGPPQVERSLERRPWHPRFGVETPAVRLVWRCSAALPFEVTTRVQPAGH